MLQTGAARVWKPKRGQGVERKTFWLQGSKTCYYGLFLDMDRVILSKHTGLKQLITVIMCKYFYSNSTINVGRMVVILT